MVNTFTYFLGRAELAPPHSSYIQKPRTIRVNHSMLVKCLNLIQIHFRVVITYHGKCGIYRHCCFMTRILRWKEVSWDLSLFQPMRDHAALQVTNQMMEHGTENNGLYLIQYLCLLFIDWIVRCLWMPKYLHNCQFTLIQSNPFSWLLKILDVQILE